jgi:hypothetical protein
MKNVKLQKNLQGRAGSLIAAAVAGCDKGQKGAVLTHIFYRYQKISGFGVKKKINQL